MEADGLEGAVELDRLGAYMKVLVHPNRLELLSLLREPKTVDEIRLTPSTPQAGGNPDRPISRQAVENHLDQLVDAGLVRVGKTQRKGKRPVNEYVVDHARVFAVIEELRQLTSLQPTVSLDPLETAGLPSHDEPDWPDGPKLVVAHGTRAGRAFPLRHADLDPPRGWIIGRDPDAHVDLEYDPFVSAENAEIVKEGDAFRLMDLRSSTNGTFLNWRQLPVGGEAELEPGDVIGVGRSLLVFREA